MHQAAVAVAGKLIHAARALAQFTAVATHLKIVLQPGMAGGGQVGAQRTEVAEIVLLTVIRPAVKQLEDIKGEGVNAGGRYFPPRAGAAAAQVRREPEGELLRRAVPAVANARQTQAQQDNHGPKRQDMVIALGQRMAKAAHRGLLRTTHTVLCWTRCEPRR